MKNDRTALDILKDLVDSIKISINAKGYEIRSLEIQEFHDLIEEAKILIEQLR